MVNDEKFFAWLDGELSAEEAAQVEAEVAANPKLSALAMQHRAMEGRVRAAFDSLLDATVPERLAAATRKRPSADVVDFASAKDARERRNRSLAVQWGAMAATLAIGIILGTFVPHQRGGTAAEVQGGRLVAAGGLARALDTELASVPSGDVRIGLTFRDQRGAICRSFSGRAASGLACRDNGRWQLRGMFAAPAGQASDYRMAAGMDPSLAALVDRSMAGEPLDAAAEREARERGWR